MILLGPSVQGPIFLSLACVDLRDSDSRRRLPMRGTHGPVQGIPTNTCACCKKDVPP